MELVTLLGEIERLNAALKAEQARSAALEASADIDALTAYLNAGYKAPNAPYDPTLPALKIPRITRLP